MDVDIDLPTAFDPLDYFPEAVRASRVENGKLLKHAAGAYFQAIPKDKLTDFAAIPYKEAEELGYFKIDFLHIGLADTFAEVFENKQQIRTLLNKDPDWTLLQSPTVVTQLFQLHSHYDLVARVRPESVMEIADCIALIRPGKRYLLDSYIKDRNAIRTELYRKTDDGKPYYKKPHAVAYALIIVLQLHLIKAGVQT